MSESQLPSCIKHLTDSLQVVQFYCRNIPIQVPKFAVYAILDNPVYDRVVYREKRRVGLIKLGRYLVPVIDPLHGKLDEQPNHVVVISQSKGNKFGLFGYPAEEIKDCLELPFYHRSVKKIVRDFV